MTTLKYVVYPGPVKSKNDGQIHFIGACQLMALYKVHPLECMVIHPLPRNYTEMDVRQNQVKEAEAERLKLTRLFPRFDGNYATPT